MANPYQIEDGESMASVRSKLNQMGEVVDGAASKEYVDDKSPEVVEEVPADYVAGKMYFLKDKEEVVTLKTYEELIAMNNSQAIVDELNKDGVAYYESLTSHLQQAEPVLGYPTYGLLDSSGGKWFSDGTIGIGYYNGTWSTV